MLPWKIVNTLMLNVLFHPNKVALFSAKVAKQIADTRRIPVIRHPYEEFDRLGRFGYLATSYVSHDKDTAEWPTMKSFFLN